jgi:hypothetical protein
MEPEFITYQKFNDDALANELADQLLKHHVKHIIEEEVQQRPTATFWAVKINSSDFEKVNNLLRDDESEDVAKIGKDYYLYAFTDDELMEVITKADEWSPFDYALARKILTENGKDISDEVLTSIRRKRIEKLKEPDAAQTGWIVIGYIFSLCGGLLGIFIGWYLSTYQKTLPNGERVYEFNEHDRKQGRWIFYIGIIVLVLGVAYKLSGIFEN